MHANVNVHIGTHGASLLDKNSMSSWLWPVLKPIGQLTSCRCVTATIFSPFFLFRRENPPAEFIKIDRIEVGYKLNTKVVEVHSCP